VRCAPFAAAESSKVDQLVSTTLAGSGVPSASVAIVQDGRIVYAKAYGARSVEPRQPATVTTRYRIASVSKQFTATAVLMLADEGKISLDDPLAKYLPELGEGDGVTVRQALSHTAGYPEFWTLDYVTPEKKRATTPEAILQRWGKDKLDFEPGSRWSYSNTGYVILGRLVEKVSGQPLGAYLNTHIFAPLQMTSAQDVDGKSRGAADAMGYSRYALGPPREAAPPAAGWTFSCGELAMTATDLAKWDISMINRTLMSSTAYSAQFAEAKLTDGAGVGYGAGLFVDKAQGHRRVRHNGDLPGFWTENRVYPDDRLAIVVMINGNYGGAPHVAIADGIERLLLPAEKSSTPSPAPGSVVRKIYAQIRTGSLDRRMLTADASDYLSGTVLTDYQRSFARLGEPLILASMVSESSGGSTVNSWLGVWPSGKLVMVLRTRADGAIEEFMASPVN